MKVMYCILFKFTIKIYY